MDNRERKELKNPRENANIISVIIYGWLWKFFAKGYKKEVTEDDLYSPLKEHTSSTLADDIGKAWENQLDRCAQKNLKPSLLRAMLKCFGKWYIILVLSHVIIQFGTAIGVPFLLVRLLHCFRTKQEEWTNEIYYTAGGFILCILLDCLLIHCSCQGFMHLGMKVRLAASTLVYRKILKLSNSVLNDETSVGQMVNFLSTDVDRLEYCFQWLHYLWLGPLQMLLVTYLVCRLIGWPGILGSLTYLFFVPMQVFLGKLISKLTFLAAKRSDDRLSLMTEIISGVQIIKMYVWELPFSHLVEKARRKEVNAIRKYETIEQFVFSFDGYIPELCVFITLLVYVLLGNRIDAEKVFSVIGYSGALRHSMALAFPAAISRSFEGLVSVRRLEKFLMSSEIPKKDIETSSSDETSLPLRLINVTGKWNDESKENTLNDINLSARPGELVAIIGQVGSGKSSVLQAILRELPLSSGTLEVRGKIGYASQQSWIFASSVKQNILFGKAMIKERYQRVLEVCQLKSDLATFSHGDKTIVGERGINLSGGQRARISLARAVYANADVYLLDDPLSAVDTHVGRRIMDECICHYLKGKTIVLVTHQVQYLSSADQVVVMKNGRIEMKGTYKEVRASEMIFSNLLNEAKETESKEENFVGKSRENGDGAAYAKEDERRTSTNESVDFQEMRTTGRILSTTYLSYLKASRSPFLVISMVLMFVLYQMAAFGTEYFVAFWVDVEERSSSIENGTVRFDWQGPVSRQWIIYIYSILIVLVVVCCFLQSVVYYAVCMRSSKNLHSNMFYSIIRTTMCFFNVNPLGRIVNRFSKDMANIDMRLPPTMHDVLVIFLSFLSMTVVISTISPWLLLLTLVIIIPMYIIRLFYISTSRSIKRLEGILRSPIFEHVGATLQGLATIRAFRTEEILNQEFDNYQDSHSSAYFLYISSSRAFGMYLDFICICFIALTVVTFLCFGVIPSIGEIGLILTQTLSVVDMLQWGVQQTAELENQMTSVERVLEFSRLEEEPLLDSDPKTKPKETWPDKGLVEFEAVRLKYSSTGGYVLKDVSFVIMPKEKIGVVGRTGAGKTSLIGALFRLAFVEGDIRIDGVSTDKISLHDFRSKISIIPQEPVLFAGSLRRNLDPFEEYPDHVLWQALREVQMKETIEETVAGLSTKVVEGGVNFSVGQRQLLCLARAIVRNNRIMVLDEATANVDPHTDSLIQQTVRKKFKDCTVITVAHRLNTVMDSNKILVMDDGRLLEFDHPHTLLQKRGHFYDMVQQTGPSMAVNLAEIAEKSFHQLHEPSFS